MNYFHWSIADQINLGFIWLRSGFTEFYRWKRIRIRRDQINIFYGYDSIPSAEEKASGGIVKIQDLQTKFPNHSKNPNVLYLVSSALPHFPVRMASLAKKSGVKLVINQNGVAYPGWYGKNWEKCNQPMKELHGLADYIFYQSKFCKMSSDHFVGDISPNWEILYNPVDTGIFRPLSKKQKNKPITILLAGSHGSFYRPYIAIKTIKHLAKLIPDIQLVIAGGFLWHRNPQKAINQVIQSAKDEGVAAKVNFVGPYTQQQAISLLNSADLLLHTKYNDPCPRLVVEAMACGLPVVYSATGGVAELVGDKAGIGIDGPLDWNLEHPPSPEILADGVLKIIDKLDTYSRAARKRAISHFDVQPWLKRHTAIFSELLQI